MKKLFLVWSLFWTVSFSYVFGQDISYSIPLDSANVINNAVVLRTISGTRQYIMMPTQYGTNIATGKPLIVVVNSSFTGNAVSIHAINGLDGLVVNDMALGSDNFIYFGGYRLGKAIYGTIDATFSNINIIYDENSLYCKAIAYKTINGGNYLFTGDQWTGSSGKISTFSMSGGALNPYYSSNFVDSLSIVDVALSQHSNMTDTYGISICRFDSRHIALFKNLIQDHQFSIISRRKLTLPQYWQWQERGGSVVRIAADKYVAAIDMRCDTVEKDGIWLVKFKYINSVLSIIDTKLMEFPTQKVFVKDLCFIDTKNGVKLCVEGQYVDATSSTSWNGCPFVLEIDTTFTNERVRLFATHYQEYGKRNFTLNKMCYNVSINRLVATGSYCRYTPTNPTGGIYLVTSNIFSNTIPQYSCAEELSITSKNTSRSSSVINGVSIMYPSWTVNIHLCTIHSEIPISVDCVPTLLNEGNNQ